MTGDLELHFYRDRLMRIEFAPRNPETYWTRLVKAEHLIVETPSQFSPEARWAKTKLPVRIELDPKKRDVAWWDERLDPEMTYRWD